MADKIAAKVIANVNRILEERAMKRQDLAEKMGIRPPSLTAMLGGKKSLKTDSIENLAKSLGVSACELLCDSKKK